MNTLNIIRTRRSTRNYLNKSVEDEKLQQVLDAGRYAPSGGNSQTTHFMVITNPEVMETLIQLVQQEFAKMEVVPGMYRSMVHSIEASKSGNYVFQYHAPVLILTANQIDYGNNIADCACALENMMIMANALDLGSCWINQLKWLNENPIITEYLHSLGLDQTERVYGAMALGYADPLNPTPLKRKGNKVTYVK